MCPTILNGLPFSWENIKLWFSNFILLLGLKFSLKIRCWNGGQTFSLCFNTICFRTGKEFPFIFISPLFLIEQGVFIYWETNKEKNGLQWVDNMTRVIFMFLKYLTQKPYKSFHSFTYYNCSWKSWFSFELNLFLV